ncbi:hypothetical protein H0H93_000715, partial [Arthromyces matolae]
FQAASGDFPKTSPDNLNESIERTVTIAIAPAFRAFYPKPEYEVKVKSLADLSKWTPEELMPIVAILKPSWVAARANEYGELNSALYGFERQMRTIGVPIFPRSKKTGETPIKEEGGVFQIQTPPLPKAIEIPLGPQSLDIPPSLQKFCGKKILKFTARKLMTKEDLKPVKEVLEQLWNAAKEGGDSVLCGDIQHFETRLIHRHVPIVQTHKARTSGSLAGMIIKPARLYSWKKDHTRKKTASRAGRSKNASVIQPTEPLAPPLNTTPLAITPHTEPSFQPPPAAAAHRQVSPTARQQDTQSGDIGYGYHQSGQVGYAGGFNPGLAVGHTEPPGAIQSGGFPPPQSFNEAHYGHASFTDWDNDPDCGSLIPPRAHLQPSDVSLSVPCDASKDASPHSDCQAASGDFPKSSPDNENIERTVTIVIPPSFRAFYPKSQYEAKVKPKMTAEELKPIVEILRPAWTAALENKYGELNRVLREFECQVRKDNVPIAPREDVMSKTPIGILEGVVMIQTPPLPKMIDIPFGRQEVVIPPSLQRFCGKKILEFTARKIMTEEDLKPVREVLELMWGAVMKEGSSYLRHEVQNFEKTLKRRHVSFAPRYDRSRPSKPQPSGAGIIKPPILSLRRKKTASGPARSESVSVMQTAEPLAPPLHTTPLGKTAYTEPSFQPPTAAAADWQVSPTPVHQHTQSGNIDHGYYQPGQAGYAGGFNLGLAAGHTDSPNERLAQLGGLPPPQSFDDTHYDPGWNDEPDYGWKDLKTPPHLYGDNVMDREAVSQQHSPGAPALALPGGLAHSEDHALFTGWDNDPAHGRQTVQTPPHGSAPVGPPSTGNNDTPRSSGTGSFSWGHQH